jgi:hypothetical protein
MEPSDNLNTHIVAVGAAVSPYWLHTLSDTSQTLLPILGVGWLLIQAGVYLYTTFWKADVSAKAKEPDVHS